MKGELTMLLLVLIILSLVLAFVPMDHTLKIVLGVVLAVLALAMLFGLAPAGYPLLR